MLNLPFSSFVGHELLHCGGADGCFHSRLFLSTGFFFLSTPNSEFTFCSTAKQKRREGRVWTKEKHPFYQICIQKSVFSPFDKSESCLWKQMSSGRSLRLCFKCLAPGGPVSPPAVLQWHTSRREQPRSSQTACVTVASREHTIHLAGCHKSTSNQLCDCCLLASRESKSL